MIEVKHEQVKKIRSLIDRFLLWSSFGCSLLVLFLVGYNTIKSLEPIFQTILYSVFFLFAILFFLKIVIIALAARSYKISFYSELVIFSYLILILLARTYFSAMLDPGWIYLGLFSVFIVEVSKSSLFFEQFYLNPTALFIISFLVLILLGTFLLLLPKSTVNNDLEFIDALFMSTSAVCVTGLSVIDISTRFTTFGQNIILLLIQLGGLGIMTFTGFFGFFFTGALSYRNQLMFTEFINESKISSVIKTLYTVIGITFVFEAVGAAFIFFTLDSRLFPALGARIHFSLFHSISAFCNAGFSTISNGLYDTSFRFNYPLQVIIALLFITGGVGFALVHNIFRFVSRWYGNFKDRILYRKAITFKPWVLSFNSRLISWTTAILIVFGSTFCFLLEYNFTLTEHNSITGKIVTAFFTGVAPRTAGFNTVSMAELSFPTLLIIMFLMWIGGSPGSTAGGIRTTTFAVAALNVLSLGKGGSRIQIFRREISDESVRRAFAIVVLSVFSLAISTFLISITDSDKHLLPLAFETVSAYSTAGLSLGITPHLSDAGKLILVITMFMGRVGALTLVITLVKSVQNRGYQYPKEEVIF